MNVISACSFRPIASMSRMISIRLTAMSLANPSRIPAWMAGYSRLAACARWQSPAWQFPKALRTTPYEFDTGATQAPSRSYFGLVAFAERVTGAGSGGAKGSRFSGLADSDFNLGNILLAPNTIREIQQHQPHSVPWRCVPSRGVPCNVEGWVEDPASFRWVAAGM